MTPGVDFEEVLTVGYEKHAIYRAAEPFALAEKVGLKSSQMAAVDFNQHHNKPNSSVFYSG